MTIDQTVKEKNHSYSRMTADEAAKQKRIVKNHVFLVLYVFSRTFK